MKARSYIVIMELNCNFCFLLAHSFTSQPIVKFHQEVAKSAILHAGWPKGSCWRTREVSSQFLKHMRLKHDYNDTDQARLWEVTLNTVYSEKLILVPPGVLMIIICRQIFSMQTMKTDVAHAFAFISYYKNKDFFHQFTIPCFTQFEATAESGFSLRYILQTTLL